MRIKKDIFGRTKLELSINKLIRKYDMYSLPQCVSTQYKL